MLLSDAGTRGARGATAPPIVGRPVNPIPTGEGRLSPPVTPGTPNVFHLPASLHRELEQMEEKLKAILTMDKKYTGLKFAFFKENNSYFAKFWRFFRFFQIQRPGGKI